MKSQQERSKRSANAMSVSIASRNSVHTLNQGTACLGHLGLPAGAVQRHRDAALPRRRQGGRHLDVRERNGRFIGSPL